MKTAVLALHYQNEVLHEDGKIRVGVAEGAAGRAALIQTAGRLLAGARAASLPLLHVRIAFRADFADLPANCLIYNRVREIGACVAGSWGTQFHEALAPLDGEWTVTHNRINSFAGTPLEQHLMMLGVQRLIVAGVATHSVVEHTVRHACDLGYHIAVCADACSAADPAVHAASLRSMSDLATITTVDGALSAL